jgi:hypothetical protein
LEAPVGDAIAISSSLDRDQGARTPRWESAGVSLEHILLYINETYAGNPHRKGWYARNFGPFPAYIANTAQGGLQLWTKHSILDQRSNYVISGRLGGLCEFWNDALKQLQTSEGQLQFPALARVLTTVGILPLIFKLDDYRGCPRQNYRLESGQITVPIITFCHDVTCPNALVVPDYKMISYARFDTPKEWDQQFERWQNEFPKFKHKNSKLFWRGANTGHIPPNANESDRVRAARIAQSNQDVMDISFVKGGNKTPIDYSMNYRAVLDMDGNSWSERFPRLLCYNSVVVKMRPWFAPYFWDSLTPWVHYLPVTLENLTDTAKFIANDKNQAFLESIVRNANDWCSHSMTKPRLKQQILSTLEFYIEQLDKNNSLWLDDWRFNHKSYVSDADFWNKPRLIELGREKRRASISKEVQPLSPVQIQVRVQR